MKVEYKKEFTKNFEKAPANIRLAFDKRFRLFLQNPINPILNNHGLKGKYQGSRSINITSDWRAIFREVGNYKLVVFETLGTHSQLYR